MSPEEVAAAVAEIRERVRERHGKTVAEIPAAVKHARSHRGQALRGFVAWLEQQ